MAWLLDRKLKTSAMRMILFITAMLTLSESSSDAQLLPKYLDQPAPGLKPVIFAPGLVSTPEQYEYGSVFSKNGEEFFYGVDLGGRAEIRYMKKNRTGWTKPATLVSGEGYSCNDPFLSPDQSKLFFISDMPKDGLGSKKDYDIWYVKREGDHWSKPINSGSNINSDKNEYYMSFTVNGTMYFSSNVNATEDNKMNYDIYFSKYVGGNFQPPVKLSDSINTNRYEADVFIAPDESYVIFCADRAEGKGKGDLYISFKKKDGTWSKSKNMGETINSPLHELCPFVSSDGKYFFYTSNKDIYWVDAKVLSSFK